jgi:DNA polymerase III delta prime subunit
MEQNLLQIAEDVEEIKKDVKYMVGKTIPELINYKYDCILRDVMYTRTWIQLEAHHYDDKSNLSEIENFNLMTNTFEFIRSKSKNTLLIVGESGAGKSTFLRYLQKGILENWKKNKGGMHEVFQGLKLNELKTIQANLEELELGRELSDIILGLTRHSYVEKLFFPSEMKLMGEKMVRVGQTKDLCEKLDFGDQNQGIIIPIWCS